MGAVMTQAICKKIGASGCYFLCLIHVANQIAGKKTDVVRFYEKALSKGWIEADCYVAKPAEIIKEITGNKADVFHAAVGYQLKQNEFEITRYEYCETGITYAHFVVTNNGKVTYDPFGSSRTVKLGKPVSKRIIKLL